MKRARTFSPVIDVFCQVVDHLGDAGVAWRLCMELRDAFPAGCIRFFIDDADTLTLIVPGVQPMQAWQAHAGIDIVRFDAVAQWLASGEKPALIVVETFGCEIPLPYWAVAPGSVQLILNLEYFTAETWTREYHLCESLLPFAGTRKFFFMPGVNAGSGGILSNSRPVYQGVHARRLARQQLLQEWGLPEELWLAQWAPVYVYPRSLAALFAVMEQRGEDMLVFAMGDAAQAEALPFISQWRQGNHARSGRLIEKGHMRMWFCPFFAQVIFDRLLALADLSLVRGEDSFAGALLAGRPFLWQLYPQTGQYQRVKLEALLTALAPVWNSMVMRELFNQAQRSFNFPAAGEERLWQEWLAAIPALTADLSIYAGKLRQCCNLTKNMVEFITSFFEEFKT